MILAVASLAVSQFPFTPGAHAKSCPFVLSTTIRHAGICPLLLLVALIVLMNARTLVLFCPMLTSRPTWLSSSVTMHIWF